MSPWKLHVSVLDTDYENYAVQYFCYRFLNKIKMELGWVLTRETEPSEKVVSNFNITMLDDLLG